MIVFMSDTNIKSWSPWGTVLQKQIGNQKKRLKKSSGAGTKVDQMDTYLPPHSLLLHTHHVHIILLVTIGCWRPLYNTRFAHLFLHPLDYLDPNPAHNLLL